jgi:integrase
MKQQKGFIFKASGAWYLKYREDVIESGHVNRKLRTRQLARVDDACRTECDARNLADEFLEPFNKGRVDVRSTMTLTEFAEQVWLPQCRENLAPATVNGYEKQWKKYLKPRIGSVAIRDFKTVTATRFLHDLVRAGIGHRTVRYAKALGSAVFSLSLSQSINTLEGKNPFKDAKLPKRISPKREMPATSPHQIADMLNAVPDIKAKAAIGLTYFGGLSPSEARGAEWENYDGYRLKITRSVWRTHAGPTKTEAREQPIPIIETLRDILNELSQSEGNPSTGPILRGERGKPLNLDNLARRVIRPALAKAGIKWNGWYANRRGAGTLVTAVAKDKGMAAKGPLRHSNLSTTTAHYVKDVPQETQQAMLAIEKLFHRSSKDSNGDTGTAVQVQ